MMCARDADKLESFLGVSSSFKGELNVEGTLRVDGTIDGQLDADCVILSERAVVKGAINAKRVIIGGKIDGIVRAQELVEIKSKGRVLGDISTPKLAVSEGGEINGKIEMRNEESKVIELGFKGREMPKFQ
jgi:cytoskeletal protein CcmA (bactofilin family)